MSNKHNNEYVPIHINITSNTGLDTLLTRGLFHLEESTEENPKEEGETSQYPYFIAHRQYSLDSFKRLPRREQVDIFFDQTKLMHHVNENSSKVGVELSDINRFNNAKHNFKVMLQVLFSTSFPIPNNVQDTFTVNIMKTVPSAPVKFKILPDFLSQTLSKKSPNEFSYINHGGIETVIQTTWCNDLINDDYYLTFFEKVQEYKEWVFAKEGPIEKYKKRKIKLENKLDHFYQNSEMFDQISGNIKYADFMKTPYVSGIMKLLKDIKDWTKRRDVLLKIDKYNREYLKNHKSRYYNSYSLPREWYELNQKLDLEKNIERAQELKQVDRLIDVLSNLKKTFSYLENGSDKSDSSEDREEIRQNIQRYAEVRNMIQLMQAFTKKRGTLNPHLQHIIDIKREDADLFAFSQYVYDRMYDKPSESGFNNDYFDLGILVAKKEGQDNEKRDLADLLNQTKDIDHYETNIYLHLAKGLLNDERLKLIHCAFKNEQLLKMYTDLMEQDERNSLKFIPDDSVIQIDSLMEETTKSRDTIMTKQQGGYKIKLLKPPHKSVKSITKISHKKGGKGARKTRKMVKKSCFSKFW